MSLTDPANPISPVAVDPSTSDDRSVSESRRSFRRPTPSGVFTFVVVVALVVVTLFPIYWAFRTALSSNAALPANSTSLLPADFSLGGFERALGLATTEESLAAGGSGAEINFLLALRNSTIVALMVTVGQVFSCALAAYAFARMRFPGRDALFFVVLSALMVPPIFTVLPNFIWVLDRGWLNTFQGIAAPTLLMTPFTLFFLRQFFLGIPRVIEEAAYIDGASRFRTFRSVILPMAASPIATVSLLTFITQWNDYLWPKLVGQDESVRVLTASLGNFQSQTPQGTPDWSGLMAAALVAAIPVLVLLLLTGRRIVNAIGFSGVK